MTYTAIEDLMPLANARALNAALRTIHDRECELLETRAQPWTADDVGWAMRESIRDYNAGQSLMEAELVHVTDNDGDGQNISITVKPVTRH